jgi:hypothetical protein
MTVRMQILMNEVMIANYEKYSSVVKDFQVSFQFGVVWPTQRLA